ncbi:hypothetical protein AX16_001694 [Volvariella volvacea WC 439]|nr:hypothetical protein AX16_001694 [Volvariella volvacea WC 439]
MAFPIPSHLPRRAHPQEISSQILSRVDSATNASLNADLVATWLHDLDEQINATKKRLYERIKKDKDTYDEQFTLAQSVQVRLQTLTANVDTLTDSISNNQTGLVPVLLAELAKHNKLAQEALNAKVHYSTLQYLLRCRDQLSSFTSLSHAGKLAEGMEAGERLNELLVNAPSPLGQSQVMLELRRNAQVTKSRVEELLSDAYSRSVVIAPKELIITPSVQVRESDAYITLPSILSSLSPQSLSNHLNTLRRDLTRHYIDNIFTQPYSILSSTVENQQYKLSLVPAPPGTEDRPTPISNLATILDFLDLHLFPHLPTSGTPSTQAAFKRSLCKPITSSLLSNVLTPSVATSFAHLSSFLELCKRTVVFEEKYVLEVLGNDIHDRQIKEWADGAGGHYERLRRKNVLEKIREVVVAPGSDKEGDENGVFRVEVEVLPMDDDYMPLNGSINDPQANGHGNGSAHAPYEQERVKGKDASLPDLGSSTDLGSTSSAEEEAWGLDDAGADDAWGLDEDSPEGGDDAVTETEAKTETDTLVDTETEGGTEVDAASHTAADGLPDTGEDGAQADVDDDPWSLDADADAGEEDSSAWDDPWSDTPAIAEPEPEPEPIPPPQPAKAATKLEKLASKSKAKQANGDSNSLSVPSPVNGGGHGLGLGHLNASASSSTTSFISASSNFATSPSSYRSAPSSVAAPPLHGSTAGLEHGHKQQKSKDEAEQKESYVVSARAKQIILLVEDVLKEGKQLKSSGILDYLSSSAPGTIISQTALSCLDLYRALYPVKFSKELQASGQPWRAMRFSNDCLWLGDEIERVLRGVGEGDAVKQKLKEEREQFNVLGESWFYDTIENQGQRVVDVIVNEAQGFIDTANQDRFDQCEAAMSKVMIYIKQVAPKIKNVVTQSKYFIAIGKIVDSVLLQVLDDMLALEDITAEESHQLAELCKILNALEVLFMDDLQEESFVVSYVPSWLKYNYLSELLEANLADITYLFEQGALIDFELEELVRIIKALFQDSPRRAEAINKIMMGHPQVPSDD